MATHSSNAYFYSASSSTNAIYPESTNMSTTFTQVSPPAPPMFEPVEPPSTDTSKFGVAADFVGKTPTLLLSGQSPFRELCNLVGRAIDEHAATKMDYPQVSEFSGSSIGYATILPSSSWFNRNTLSIHEVTRRLKNIYGRTSKILGTSLDADTYQFKILVQSTDERYLVARVIPKPTYCTIRVLEYGFGGYGMLFRDFSDGVGLSLLRGVLKSEIVASGETLGSIQITSDQHLFESMLGFDRTYPRLTYGIPNADSLFNVLVTSPFFNLACAKLDDNLASTVATPSLELTDFQAFVRQRMPSNLYPAVMLPKQRSTLDASINCHYASYLVDRNRMLDTHHRLGIQVSKLSEAQDILGIGKLKFDHLVSSLRAKVGESKFEFEVLSSNPLSLVEKLKVFA